MKRRLLRGVPVYHYCGPGLASCRRWWALPRGEKWWCVQVGKWLYTWRAVPITGLWLVAVDLVDGQTLTRIWESSYELADMGIKRRAVALKQQPLPELSRESTILKKCPALMEFLTATQFDDGSCREPGYYSMRNRGASFELTIYDPNAGLRLPVNAATHDACFAMVEQHLGVDEAPWQVDRYLAEQCAKKSKKK